MSTYNVTYDVLKEYQIVPLQSGAMQRNRRISLAQFADARAGFLEVNRPRIQRIFIPLETFPTPRRGRITELIKFFNSIQTINRGRIAAKASKIILIAYFEDLEPNSVKPLSPETPRKAGKFRFCCAWFYDTCRVC